MNETATDKEQPGFSAGDVVQVKSGGPALTVLSHDDKGVRCLFFSDEQGEFRETVIPAFALDLYVEAEFDDEDDASADLDDEDDDEDEDEDDEQQ